MKLALGGGGLRLEVHGLQGLMSLTALVLMGLALAEQLRLPPAQRTWHGHLWGLVPYDFRTPTLDRLWKAVWDPDSQSLVKDKALGLGWDVNFATVARHFSNG